MRYSKKIEVLIKELEVLKKKLEVLKDLRYSNKELELLKNPQSWTLPRDPPV